MRFTHSLRFRVTASFALLGAVLSVLLSLGVWVAVNGLERRLVSESLAGELDDYAAQRRADPDTAPVSTHTLRSYVRVGGSVAHVPPALRGLPPGFRSVTVDGRAYFARVEDHGPVRYYMLYARDELDARGRELAGLLAVGVALTTLVAAAGGRWLAGRVIAPVGELARRVSRLGPADRPHGSPRDFADDEVGELARAFDRYRDRLQAFVERERAFTGDVSHELRTSLAVINGTAEVLLGRETLAEDARRRVERVARAAREMSEVTEALLVLARESDGDASERAPCAVDDVLAEVAEDHRHLLEGKPVALAVASPARVELPVERALLRVVVGNLVRNAFSYTESGRIDIRLESTGLTIEDTGPGIAPERAARLFERCHRGGERAGAGIGLALVKRICDRHGWKVSIASADGVGTVTRVAFSTPPDGDIRDR